MVRQYHDSLHRKRMGVLNLAQSSSLSLNVYSQQPTPALYQYQSKKNNLL
jgi:hypothetical protein